MKAVAYTRQDNLRDAEDLARMLELLDSLPVPLIGRVHGAALGGGAGLVAVCDIVVAADDAVFAFSEAKLGILPAVISPYALAKIGRSAARELFLTAARFDAVRAREIGLVHRVAPLAALDHVVAGYIGDILTSAPDGRRRREGPDPRDPWPPARRGHRRDHQPNRRATRLGRRTGRDARVPRKAQAELDSAAAMTIRRVLIANRGEIAVRIARACREAGLESVAVYSDADAEALHVRTADQAVRIGPAAAADSYLSVAALLDAAARSEADAIHPGYGFLSERPELPRACAQAGIVFVGPPAEVMERMGSKIGARALMHAAGVPIVPGDTPRDQSDEGVLAAARGIGSPVLVKASAGGGGKGMRVVRQDADAAEGIEAIGAARREAVAAFGDGTLYVERLIERPRHVEVQIFADDHGNVVHLFERECSVQRRHQKVIEESPSLAITAAVRQRMGEAAVAAARAAGYRNAGTIEFLVEGEGESATFFFLEMNTRLQVEHPVTEAVAGVDLVRAQFIVAAGGHLPWTQAALSQRGHALECRIYAEDPAQRLSSPGGAARPLSRALGARRQDRFRRRRGRPRRRPLRSAAREAGRPRRNPRGRAPPSAQRPRQLPGARHPHQYPVPHQAARAAGVSRRASAHRHDRRAPGRTHATR